MWRIAGIGVVLLGICCHAVPVSAQSSSDSVITLQQGIKQFRVENNYKGSSPRDTLILAVATKNTAKAREALNKGAEVDLRGAGFGTTPLTLAALHHDLHTMKLLISRGADVNAKSAGGQYPFYPMKISRHVTTAGPQADFSNVPPHWLYLNTDCVGVTPLLSASASGSALAVKLLLDKGASVNVATRSGETPLMAAAYAGYLPAVEALLKAGAKVNATNWRGYSALSFAALEGHTEVARLLLRHGADSSLKFDGYALAQIAQGFGYANLQKMLNGHLAWQRNQPKRDNNQNSIPVKRLEEPAIVKIISSDGSVQIVR